LCTSRSHTHTHTHVQDAVSREAADRELIKAAAGLGADLERAAPNMKAVEQYAAVQVCVLGTVRIDAHASTLQPS
jgi:hypothetical protein